MLIKRGANINAKSAEGQTLLDLVLASARGYMVDALGVNLWTPAFGKARLFFVGSGLYDYLKVAVGKEAKRLNQNMFVGLAFFDVNPGTHFVDVNEFHGGDNPKRQTAVIDVTLGQT